MRRLKILVVSNLYPPHYIGGYELGCHDVVEGLKARGHHVSVLTSTYGLGSRMTNGGVMRWLEATIPGRRRCRAGRIFNLFRREFVNRSAFYRAVRAVSPDVVFAWNMRFISLSLLFAAQTMNLPLCYFISDNGLARGWESIDEWYGFWGHTQIGPLERRLKDGLARMLDMFGWSTVPAQAELRLVQFASRYLRDTALEAGLRIGSAEVIHWGVDVSKFQFNQESGQGTRLLYVGQLAPHKGVGTAIEALGLVRKILGNRSVSLTITGGCLDEQYRQSLLELIGRLGLEDNVSLLGSVDRDDLGVIYKGHDILIFPSVWDEPFSITLLEAMACGLAVVSTMTGGSREVLRPEINALIFDPEDATACASQVSRLITDKVLRNRIRCEARACVEKEFQLNGMILKIEESLARFCRE